MKTKFHILVLVLVSLLALSACSLKAAEENNAKTQNAQAASANNRKNGEEVKAADAATAATVPTKENPLVVDKENKAVKVYAEVNEKYKEESTMHMIVSASGKEADHAMFRSAAKALDFYDALNSLGLKAGDNMTMDNAGKAQVEGDALDVTFQFDGNDKVFKIDEVVDDSSKQPIDIRFGGNHDTQEKLNSGCISCLLSCPAGITSNHTHKIGDDEKEKFTLMLNKDNVPADKTPVVITFAAK
ncbi:MAG: YdjY domain-containing protein [Peptoniphilus sp.]|nr:YdjY domain-containing protein [Peptoniphilus sp.]MDY3118985.1 YdjY domain-containing protein [Peptoniphilus sp.]